MGEGRGDAREGFSPRTSRSLPARGKEAVLATCSGYKAMKEEVGDMPSVESFHQLCMRSKVRFQVGSRPGGRGVSIR